MFINTTEINVIHSVVLSCSEQTRTAPHAFTDRNFRLEVVLQLFKEVVFCFFRQFLEITDGFCKNKRCKQIQYPLSYFHLH